ncbi:DUF177 domain-containing protein [Geobacter sp. DSM 9736]|uniref:YceD family protein n=1 Tax=Geobacter sp. DSM 9736 TaxID=1277350 RepID=UPI000B50E2D1|nr:DUF177 domain-containing protein [Geobacter sp. DSM 9736]
MKVHVEEIKDKPKVFSVEEPVEDYPILLSSQDAGECRFVEPLKLWLTVTREFDHIRVNGRVETRVLLDCSRCLAGFEAPVVSNFTVFYSREADVPQDEEVELAEADLVSATYRGDVIDLNPEIAEQVMMEIPLKPLCNEECQGLCNKCGADLNKVECGCDRSDLNFKMSVLKSFKVNK